MLCASGTPLSTRHSRPASLHTARILPSSLVTASSHLSQSAVSDSLSPPRTQSHRPGGIVELVKVAHTPSQVHPLYRIPHRVQHPQPLPGARVLDPRHMLRRHVHAAEPRSQRPAERIPQPPEVAAVHPRRAGRGAKVDIPGAVEAGERRDKVGDDEECLGLVCPASPPTSSSVLTTKRGRPAVLRPYSAATCWKNACVLPSSMLSGIWMVSR